MKLGRGNKAFLVRVARSVDRLGCQFRPKKECGLGIFGHSYVPSFDINEDRPV
jgi:hypothetical protein